MRLPRRMQEAEYRVSRADKVHRIAVWIAAPLVALVLYYGAGRGAGLMFFSLAAIWFADDLSGVAVTAGGGWISPLKAPQVIRWVGWILFGWILFSSWSAVQSRRERDEERDRERLQAKPVKEWWQVED